MNWIVNIKNKSEEDLINILYGINGLDGAYAEGYCCCLKDIFLQDRKAFIKALYRLDDEQISMIGSFIGSISNQDEIDDIKNLLNSSEISDEQRNKLEIFINSFVYFYY